MGHPFFTPDGRLSASGMRQIADEAAGARRHTTGGTDNSYVTPGGAVIVPTPGGLTVQTTDGATTIANVSTIEIDANLTLTNDGGKAKIKATGGGSYGLDSASADSSDRTTANSATLTDIDFTGAAVNSTLIGSNPAILAVSGTNLKVLVAGTYLLSGTAYWLLGSIPAGTIYGAWLAAPGTFGSNTPGTSGLLTNVGDLLSISLNAWSTLPATRIVFAANDLITAKVYQNSGASQTAGMFVSLIRLG